MKIKEWCTVISQEEIGKDIYSMWLQTEQIGKEAKAGQFISLYTGEGSKLLPDRSACVRLTVKTAGCGSCIG